MRLVSGLVPGLVDFDRIRVRFKIEGALAVGGATRPNALFGICPERLDDDDAAATALAITMPIEVILDLRGSAHAHGKTPDGNPRIIDIKGDRNIVEGRGFITPLDADRACPLDRESNRESGLREKRRWEQRR